MSFVYYQCISLYFKILTTIFFVKQIKNVKINLPDKQSKDKIVTTKYLKNIIGALCLISSGISCTSSYTNVVLTYQNTNFVYLSHNKGVDLLDTQVYRVVESINQGENSGSIGIIDYGKKIIINNIDKKRLDIYSVHGDQGSTIADKIGEIKVNEPITDIVFKNNEAYVISENKVTFIKDDNIPQVSGSLTFDQSKLVKGILSKNSDELFVYDSAKQEFLIFDIKQKSQLGSLKINQDISIGGLDIDTDKRLFFTDKNKSDIYVYDLNKKELLKKITIPMPDGEFSQPTDLKIFEKKKIYVANSNKDYLAIIDYQSLDITKEIKSFREKDRSNKLSFTRYPDLTTILLATCECSEGFKIIDIEKDRYKLLFSTRTVKPPKYDFIALANPLVKY